MPRKDKQCKTCQLLFSTHGITQHEQHCEPSCQDDDPQDLGSREVNVRLKAIAHTPLDVTMNVDIVGLLRQLFQIGVKVLVATILLCVLQIVVLQLSFNYQAFEE